MGEAPQLGIKRIVVKAPAELPFLVMAWHAPTLRDAEKDWKPYALEVLTGVLDGNSSARLNKALVREQQVAQDVGAGYDSVARGPGLFVLEATPREGRTVADARPCRSGNWKASASRTRPSR
jgi:zinc protease